MHDATATSETGAATGGVRALLRLEGVVLFAGMTLLYALWDGSWWVYAILFLAPDLSFAAISPAPERARWSTTPRTLIWDRSC
jgi:hypothetical protein